MRCSRGQKNLLGKCLRKFLTTLLANIRHETTAENMLEIFRNIGGNMSLNCTSFTVIWIPCPHPHPQSNFGDISDLHGMRFHHHISTMVKCYHRKWSPALLAYYCWQRKRENA
jgi:hypothetical protein